MELILTTSLICFLAAVGSDLLKWLRVTRYFINSNTNDSANRNLQEQLQQSRRELENISMQNDDGEYIRLKVHRANEQVQNVERKIIFQQNIYRFKVSSADYIASLALKVILSIILSIICMRHRYDPVLILSPQLNLTPIEGLLSFPTGVDNAISVPMWIFSCHATFRLAVALLK